MEVTTALVDQLAHLARLHFAETEKEAIRKDLQQMIGFVEKLGELDLEGVEPLLYVNEATGSQRDDQAGETISPEDALKNAPVHNRDFFLVPRVIRR